MLLTANHGGGPAWSDAAIAEVIDINASTVVRVRWQDVQEGLDASLARTRPDRRCAATG